MMPLAMLGSTIPTSGANYRYPSRMVSPGLAFVGIWVYAWASFFGQIPLYAIGCARYAQPFLPGVSPTLLAVSLVTVCYIVNLLGVRLAAQLQGFLVIILISALIYYAGSGLAVMKLSNFSPRMSSNGTGLALGTALLTFTYFGANGIIELGGEIVDPGKVIPRAFIIAFVIVVFIYVAVAVATVGAATPELLEGAEEPLIQVCRRITGPAGILFFTVGGAVLALATTLNALFIIGTKSLLMMAGDRLLPAKLGSLHHRFGTPHVLLTLVWILSVIGIFSGFSLETFASYAALGGMIIFLPVMAASVRLPTLYPEQYANSGFKLKGFWLWFCPIVGMLLMVFFGTIILIDLKSVWKIGWFMVFIISGIIYYQWRKRHLAGKGIRIDDLLKAQL
jgi:APA family basic amino acid/polyamine antiporter